MDTEIPRQMVHLSGLIFVVLAQLVGRGTTIVYFSMITLFFLLYSWYIKHQEKRFFETIESRFRDFILKFERKDVSNPFTGAMFFYLGFTLTFLIFPVSLASAACAMLAVGDSFSTLVGMKFGRHRIGRKSLEGSLACFAGSLVSGMFFVPPHISLAGALAACMAELLPKLNDNLTIPLASGFVMFVASLL